MAVDGTHGTASLTPHLDVLSTSVSQTSEHCTINSPLTQPGHTSCNCNCNYSTYNVSPTIRLMVHYRVKTCCSQLHKSETYIEFCLNDAADHSSLSSVDSLFQVCSPATKKALVVAWLSGNIVGCVN